MTLSKFEPVASLVWQACKPPVPQAAKLQAAVLLADTQLTPPLNEPPQ